MPDFATKSREISNSLDRLITELTAVEKKVASTSDRFSKLADQASRVGELETSVTGLRGVLDKLDAPFLNKLEESTSALNRILEGINPRGLQQLNVAYDQQINKLQEILSLQRQLNTILEKPRIRQTTEGGFVGANTGGKELLGHLLQSPTPRETQGAAPAQNVQGFDAGDFLRKLSRGYGQANYASSQLGSLFNAALEGHRGFETIRKGDVVGGGLDVSAGLIKGINAIATLSDTMRRNTGVGFLPQGVGTAFNKRRSDTVLDLIEIITGVATGRRRTTSSAEEASQNKQSGISTGKAYRAGDAKAKGAQFISDNDLLSVREGFYQVLTEAEKSISTQINEAIREFLGHNTAKDYTNTFVMGKESSTRAYGKDMSSHGGAASFGTGASGNTVPIQSVFPTKNSITANPLEVMLHEISHSATIDPESPSYLNQHFVNPLESSKSKLSELSNTRMDQLENPDVLKELLAESSKAGQFSTMGNRLLSQKDYAIGKPEEAVANVGSVLLANQKELTDLVTKIYGPDLFEHIKQNLQKTHPDIYGDEAVKSISPKYDQYNEKMRGLLASSLKNSETGSALPTLRDHDFTSPEVRQQKYVEGLQTTRDTHLETLKKPISELARGAIEEEIKRIESELKGLGISYKEASIGKPKTADSNISQVDVKATSDPRIEKLKAERSKTAEELKAAVGEYYKESLREYIQYINEQLRSLGVSDIATNVQGISSPTLVNYVRDEVKTYLTDTEKQISDTANEAVKGYLGGTKGAAYSNVVVNSTGAASKLVGEKQSYSGFGGYNAYLNGSAYQALATDPLSQMRASGNQGFVALHELSHAAVNDTNLNQAAISSNTEQRARELTLQERDKILEEAKGSQFKGVANRLLDQKDYSVAKPEEAYANVGATLLANQGELTKLVTRIYGQDLFNSIKGDLQKYQPEVFGEEVVKKIGNQYHVLNQQLNQAISSAVEVPPEAAIQQKEITLKEFIDSIFSGLSNVLAPDTLQTLRQHADNVTETVRSVLLQIIEAVNPQQLPTASAATGAQGFSLPTAKGVSGIIGKLNYGALQGNLLNQLVGSQLAPILQGALSNLNVGQIKAQLQSGGGINVASIQTQVKQVFNSSLDAILQKSFSVLVTDTTRPSIGKFLSDVVPGGTQSSIAKSLFGQVTDPNSLLAKVGLQKPLQNTLAYQVGQQFRPAEEPNYFNEINNQFLAKAGTGLQKGSYNQQLTYDFNEGITRVSASAKTASGAMVQLNGRVNEFNDLVLETSKENPLSKFMEQFLIQIPRQFADQFIYGMVGGVQLLLQEVIKVQSELTEVQAIFEKLGDTSAKKSTSDFLYSSIDTANKTGQPLII